ncbi:putative dual specificity mitogen-activated protein kinase kinase 5 [Apostichopus japonicus]|uniref:mitogen-activated protein kinase kinase n=1 Tax=Stichopus japonicus TaxID=307972 RepID=A0A2G8JQX5_STIJA|nr:putative dual specificity mitogen-activated protein kinase kinase 5 [Apostichopus japonicus]
MASNKQPIVFRIKTQHGEDMDWTMSSPNTRFAEVMGVIAQVLQQNSASAFEYEDEDGDRITVRGDPEMVAMMDFYMHILSESEARNVMAPPLCIYPKIARGMRKGAPGLTVNTRPAGAVARGADSGISLQYAKHEANFEKYYQEAGAFHVPTNTEMAMKVIELDITPEARKQIMSELQVLYKCDCPCIISFYGAFFKENQISMFTEYMDGRSLEVYSPIPENILGRIAVSVVKGLNYLWNLKILHRDIKPSNILVNTRGDVKLCDFGVSTQLINSIAKTYIGTNAYMAFLLPEGMYPLCHVSTCLLYERPHVQLDQFCSFCILITLYPILSRQILLFPCPPSLPFSILFPINTVQRRSFMFCYSRKRVLGHKYGVHSEVWSVGLFLLEMATGRFPYPVANHGHDLAPLHILQCIVHEVPPRLSVEKFTREFSDFVACCMEKEHSKRPSPELVLLHPFIRMYDDNDKQMIGCWVYTQLQAKEGGGAGAT